jgi:uncharacterized membrane protein YkvA (DUF1232 family)
MEQLTEAGPENGYSDESFWAKVKDHARRAGRKVLEKALALYYCLKDADTPAWARTVIVGALAYFILPMDAIPDYLAVVGFTDDLGALAAAALTVAAHIKDDHLSEARATAMRWLGPAEDSKEEPGPPGA